MKKQLFIGTCALFLTLCAQAQISIIPKGGITLSTISYDMEPNGQESRFGFVGGAGFEFGIIKNFFSVQPELLFIQKGEQYDEMQVKTKSTLNYLELPVMAKISFGSPAIKGYLNAGPSLAMGLTGKYKVQGGMDAGEMGIRFGDSMDNTRRYIDNRFDFGLQFGGGCSIGLGPGSIIADVRYGLGFSDLDSQDKSKNRSWAFTLGYAIPISGK